jgi:hypothetical protein
MSIASYLILIWFFSRKLLLLYSILILSFFLINSFFINCMQENIILIKILFLLLKLSVDITNSFVLYIFYYIIYLYLNNHPKYLNKLILLKLLFRADSVTSCWIQVIFLLYYLWFFFKYFWLSVMENIYCVFYFTNLYITLVITFNFNNLFSKNEVFIPLFL